MTLLRPLGLMMAVSIGLAAPAPVVERGAPLRVRVRCFLERVTIR